MQYMKVHGNQYPVIGQVKSKNDDMIPLLDIKMVSDEEWQRMAEEQAVKNYRKWYGREPLSIEEACEGQRAYVEKNFIEVPKAGEEGNRSAISVN